MATGSSEGGKPTSAAVGLMECPALGRAGAGRSAPIIETCAGSYRLARIRALTELAGRLTILPVPSPGAPQAAARETETPAMI
jgi:hypothetical protein